MNNEEEQDVKMEGSGSEGDASAKENSDPQKGESAGGRHSQMIRC